MAFCTKCGKELTEGAAFCVGCGAPVGNTAPVSAAPQVSEEDLAREEREFLDDTHRLLRWEMKAWNIASKVFIIMGIAYAALFMLLFMVGIILTATGDSYGGSFTAGISFVYAIIFGGMFIALGIVSKKAAEKIPQYIDTVYTDLSLTYNRCGNVGMLVFTVILGVVSPIFFIINFVRMKTNRAVIERIMQKQTV